MRRVTAGLVFTILPVAGLRLVRMTDPQLSYYRMFDAVQDVNIIFRYGVGRSVHGVMKHVEVSPPILVERETNLSQYKRSRSQP